MPYTPQQRTIKLMVTEVYKELIANEIINIAHRIARNNNVGSLDANSRLPGDQGYTAYKKLTIFVNSVLSNPYAFLERFHSVYSNFVPRYDIREQLNELESNPGYTNIQDMFFNDTQMIYDLASIIPADFN
jgi:hypothetical protein